jgi:MFS transporter, NNP family, nitrate/nitrite transporter
LYYKYTQDAPEGNFKDLNREKATKEKPNSMEVIKDWRVWSLAVAYSICFGMEITFDNVAALHFVDTFNVEQKMAGFLAGIFGLMNIFARALGGIFADKMGRKFGLSGKGWILAVFIAIEGLGLIFFAKTQTVGMAIFSMVIFALFLKMANGATYALTPFLNIKNVGLVAGIVGAGGNIGGMLMGFLFKSEKLTYAMSFEYIGYMAIAAAILVGITKFSKAETEVSPKSKKALA